jgi:outer membrane cobalamin receptor
VSKGTPLHAAVLALSTVFTCEAAFAADTPAATPGTGDLRMDIEVIASRLDIARQQIQPSLGATIYSFSPEALQDIPQGGSAPLNQILLQAPGVAQDSFGQIHLRGEHANVQFRLNGVELPEGLSVFGQVIAARFARSLTMITGALPAQYGFQTAGVVDIQTKTGLTNPGVSLSMYGGSWNWLQPSLEYGGHSGPVAASRTRPGVTPPSTIRPTSFTASRIFPAWSIRTRGSA